MIRLEDVSFCYGADTKWPVKALDCINLEIREGEFVAIVGHNGSGKSTLAKHLNALLLPTRGVVWVDGLSTKDKANIWKIRQKVGMVFQNPDDQLVATVVEDDVAFGAENLGVPDDEIQARVDEALRFMGIEDLRQKPPHMLSGGQKQRVAIAGILAMRSRYIVMDEPTSLLDPVGRREVMESIRKLKMGGLAVVLITHHMQEAAEADKVVVLNRGRIMLSGTPRDVFARASVLRELGLDVPPVTRLADELRRLGMGWMPPAVLSVDELVSSLRQSDCFKSRMRQ